jgi:hypothetical protein
MSSRLRQWCPIQRETSRVGVESMRVLSWNSLRRGSPDAVAYEVV